MINNSAKCVILALLLGVSSSIFAQNVGINVMGSTPSVNAILDLNTGNAKNVGLLIPRVVLGSSLTTFSPPMANGASGLDSGMVVFNWLSTNQPIGYYYWTGSTWANFASGTTSWLLTGNSGTTPSTAIIGHTVTNNFIGTTDAQDFVIATDNFERMRITSGGKIGIGTKSPASTLDDSGSMGNGIVDIPTQANGYSGNLTGFGKGSAYVANPPTLVASTYTLVLPSPSLNPRQIYTIVYNGSSLGTINIQTPTANTINAAGTYSTNFALNAGAVVLQSDGTNWNIIGETFAVTKPNQLIGVKVFSVSGAVASQSFDAGTTSIQFKLVGGGGAGGGIASNSTKPYLPGEISLVPNEDWDGAGGGAGGYCEGFLNNITSASTFSGAVGSGGVGGVPTLSGDTAAVVCTPPASGNGGATTLTIVNPAGGVYTANGGTGGGTTEMSITKNPSILLAGGAGGTASGGSINITGSSGGDCVVTWEGSNQTDEGGSGGGSIFGSGGFGNLTRDPTALAGNNATGVGAGGAGACVAHASHTGPIDGSKEFPGTDAIANTNGGNGATGIIIIYEY